jgi:hypothetical protein
MAGTSLKCYIVGKENMLKAESPHKRGARRRAHVTSSEPQQVRTRTDKTGRQVPTEVMITQGFSKSMEWRGPEFGKQEAARRLKRRGGEQVVL